MKLRVYIVPGILVFEINRKSPLYRSMFVMPIARGYFQPNCLKQKGKVVIKQEDKE